MKKYPYARACLKFLLNLLLCSVLLYLLLYLSPGNPALAYLRRSNSLITTETLKQAQAQLGLSDNFFIDYGRWLMKVLSGNLGQSFSTGDPVAKILVERLRVTGLEVVIGFIISLPLSLFLGFFVGYLPKKHIYRPMLILLTILLSLPIYWLALLLIYFFGFKLQLLPFVGSASLKHIVLPIMANVIPATALASKLIAELVQDLRKKECHQIAKYRKIKRRYRLYYVLVDLSIPLVTIIGYIFLGLLGGTYLIEQIFSISGLGKLLLDAIYARDYPLVLAAGLLTSFVTFLVYFLSDLILIRLNGQPEKEEDALVQ